MANKEQLAILKKGVEVWNKWRKGNSKIEVDLSGAILKETNFYGINLSGANLSGADLSAAILIEANFGRANLSRANLSRANLYQAEFIKADLDGTDLNGSDLSRADLRAANLSGADLKKTDLSRANLREANLSRADLWTADLSGADLRAADLWAANLNSANLSNANLFRTNFNGGNLGEASLYEARLGYTIFAEIDLSKTKELDSTQHEFPSNISSNVLQLSKGEIPEVFLRGCGLSDWEIEAAKLYKPGLSNQEIIDINYKIFDLRANLAIQVSPLFISYSHVDAEFVDKLEPQFVEKGIRFWRDTHNMTSGRMEKQVDYAMRQNPTVVLVLSENSIRSDWVEHEATLARKLEKEFGRDVLCPVALDDSWKSARWPARLMEQIMEYNILDFSKWRDDAAFAQGFNKMLSGLDMFYKPEGQK